MRKSVAVGLLTAAIAVSAPSVQAQATNASIDAVLGDHRPYEKVILAAQKAVAAHDARAVAALALYPIEVMIGSHRVTVRTPAQFVARYDQIVTPAIARVVASQAYDTLFVRDQGVMFGNGEMWISGLCLDRACTKTRVGIKTIQHGP